MYAINLNDANAINKKSLTCGCICVTVADGTGAET